MSDKLKKLTPKEEAFCQEYLVTLNGTQSAIKVGYAKNSARVTASKMLTKANIQARLVTLTEKRNERTQIKQDDVLTLLRDIATADVTETMELTFEQIKQLPKPLRLCIASHKKTVTKELSGAEKVTYEIKFIDKMRAIDMINKHIGLYKEDNTQKGVNIVVKRPTKEIE